MNKKRVTYLNFKFEISPQKLVVTLEPKPVGLGLMDWANHTRLESPKLPASRAVKLAGPRTVVVGGCNNPHLQPASEMEAHAGTLPWPTVSSLGASTPLATSDLVTLTCPESSAC